MTSFTLLLADNLSLTEICNGTYSAKRVSGVNPLNDGESYSQISPDRKKILKMSFRNGEQTAILFDADNVKGHTSISSIDGYQMSPNETHILIRTNTRQIYRHSHTATYYIYNVKNRTLAPLSEGGPHTPLSRAKAPCIGGS